MKTQNAIAKPPPSPSPSASQGREAHPASRWYYLDWLRVFALLTVFLFHNTKIFNYGDDWYIKNDQLNWGMTLFDRFFELWGMPLFFVISAVGIYFSLNKRKNGQFLAERFKRLFIPLLLGIFVLSPPVMYIDWITHRQFTGSFWQFFPITLTGWRDLGVILPGRDPIYGIYYCCCSFLCCCCLSSGTSSKPTALPSYGKS